MDKGETFKGKKFLYRGNINLSLEAYPLNEQGTPTGTVVHIDPETINLIKRIVERRSPIKMGACRDNPTSNSLGEMLYRRRKSPQWLSYILPLLEREGLRKRLLGKEAR